MFDFKIPKMSRASLVLIMIAAGLFLWMVVTILVANFKLHTSQHFYYLADSFLHGRLYFGELPQPKWGDVALFNNHAYWPLGPFPAIILMPFVFIFKLFNVNFYQGYLQPFLTSLVLYFIYKLARKHQYSKLDSFWFVFAFLSSIFFYVAWLPHSHMFAHVITVALLFGAFWEYYSRRRYWLIGLILGFLFITRAPTVFAGIFFLFDIVLSRDKTIKQKVNNFFEMATPFLVVVAMMGFYNYYRFGNIFEQGYSYAILAVESIRRAREYGVFSLLHLPGNLYYAFLNPPLPVFKDSISHVLAFPFIKPDPWGMSIFFTSPYLVYLFFSKHFDRLGKLLLISALAISLPIFLNYGIGYHQFGYRYSLDFMPLLYLLFIRQYKLDNDSLSPRMKLLILVSAIVNMYLFVAMLPTLFSL